MRGAFWSLDVKEGRWLVIWFLSSSPLFPCRHNQLTTLNFTHFTYFQIWKYSHRDMREPSSVGVESTGVVSSPPQALLERLKDYGQEDVFALWDELSHEERDFLVKDIEVNLSRSIVPDSITNTIQSIIRFAIQLRFVYN